MPIRFSVIGINHNHIYAQVDIALRAGAQIVAFHAPEDDLAATFQAHYPQAARVREPRQILEDETVHLILSAAIPDARAAIGIAAMRHGKDFMVDKPGMVTLAELDEVRRVQAETGRIYSICYTEHLETRSTVMAGDLVGRGAIGQVVQVMGLGPHRLNRPARPDWFFERSRYGGILTDIASHQFEQFLFFTGDVPTEVTGAFVANRAHPDAPGLQDFGEATLRTQTASGYIRVDWFTPDGLPTWGDGRLMIVGTEGTIELRKYVDIGGQPGADHLFLVNRRGIERLDCSFVDLPYGRHLMADIRDRTETAMPQSRTFKAMELALTAQALAERAAAAIAA